MYVCIDAHTHTHTIGAHQERIRRPRFARLFGLRARMASSAHDARVLTAILHEARGAALSSPSSATTGDGDVEINLLQA